ncbi:tryptophan--tRNA ligase [Bacillus sp. FSL W7-1282]
MAKRSLTGIKPTGEVHLGNYIGAIKPALTFAKQPGLESFYFIANAHGLTKITDSEEMRQLTRGIAATWLALGLDPDKSVFYRQSDVPEVFELSWLLACMAPKGLLNRAHAYKAAVDENKAAGKEADAGVNMGLFTYPILMAADILLFQPDVVPVGRDQIQHIEIARDVARQFNHIFGDVFKLPRVHIEEKVAVLPGLDGRKMSKSYGNTIPLFSEANELQRLVNRIKTDSLPPEAPKDPQTSNLFTLYKEFAEPRQVEAMRIRFGEGIGWGEVKKELYWAIDEFMSEPRRRYNELLASPEVDRLLAEGAERARAYSQPFLQEIKKAVGL